MYTRAVYLIILFGVLYVFAIPHQNHLLSKRRKYCGDQLTATLRLICNGNYYEKALKRGGNNYMDFEEKLKNYLEETDDELEYPFIPSELVESLIPLKVRKGVVDECCYQSCSLAALSMYCG